MGDLINNYPFFRHLLVLSPGLLDASFPANRMANILEVSEDGQPVKLYGDSTGQVVKFGTAGTQVGEFLYVGSLISDFIGQLSTKA